MEKILAIIILCLMCGCVSQDPASRHTGSTPFCLVHKKIMHPEWVSVSPGEIVYLPEYAAKMKTSFPNHGGAYFSSERGYRYESVRRVREFVCGDCSRKHDEYWSKSPRVLAISR